MLARAGGVKQLVVHLLAAGEATNLWHCIVHARERLTGQPGTILGQTPPRNCRFETRLTAILKEAVSIARLQIRVHYLLEINLHVLLKTSRFNLKRNHFQLVVQNSG